MAFVFELPEVGEGVVEAEVLSWHVREGDLVTADQPLCEITTDKATLEISSPKTGRIVKLHGKPGEIVRVHAPLVEIDTDSSTASPTPTPTPTPTPSPSPAPAPVQAESHPTNNGTRAAPAVRREARELGIDIHQVPGSGPGGRITRDDLHTHGTQRPVAQAPIEVDAEPEILPQRAPALPMVTPSGSETRIKLVGIRRKIAEQMRKSKSTAAHFTYVEEVDCAELVDLRNRMKKIAGERGIRITYIPILMKAASVVLRAFPNLNAVMDEDAQELVVKADHHIGLSTDTPNGLFVPVVKNVEQKSILELAVEIEELTGRTRAGKARLDELRGGTFTMTSVGSIGGAFATPILNIPEVAILGVNAIRDAAVVRDGQIVIRPMMYLSPSFDHRIIDGAVGARFVAALKDVIEHPEKLWMELR